MDNTFVINQIKKNLYRCIVRMENCIKRMCEVQAQNPNDYNNDETYQEADRSWHLAYGAAKAYARSLHHLTNESANTIYQDAYYYVDLLLDELVTEDSYATDSFIETKED